MKKNFKKNKQKNIINKSYPGFPVELFPSHHVHVHV